MRWPFGKKPEYYEEQLEEGKPRKPKETLASASEKILIKNMKQDPEYGLKIAEKIKGVHAPEAKSLTEMLKEFREIEGLLGSEAEDSSFIKQVTQGISAAAMTALVPMFQAWMETQQAKATGQIQQPHVVAHPALQPSQTHRIQAEPEVGLEVGEEVELEQQQQSLQFDALIPLLDLEASEFIDSLREDHPDWLAFLRNVNYEQLQKILSPLIETSEYSEEIRALLSEERKPWVKAVLALAKQSL